MIWNFTSSGKNVGLNNNASSYPGVAFHGIILAPNDKISLVNANLSGRVFGGGTAATCRLSPADTFTPRC